MASDGEISCTNDPNFAVIYSFLKVFGKLYGLEVPTIVKLQEYVENTQEVLDPLRELHIRLLRRALKSVQSNRWERSLIKFCHQYGHHQEAWEIERFSYKKASTPVKLKVLKFLLEYQFTCHPKFKAAVNAITCKDLRLEPIGRDRNGCVYWYQVDDDANMCLYKEDQDEETWQIIARSREELVKVITQLKNGEEICPLVSSVAQEDSSSADVPSQLEIKLVEADEENEDEDEFLSPESESDIEDQNKSKQDSARIDDMECKKDNVAEERLSKADENINNEVEDTTTDELENKENKEIKSCEDESNIDKADSKEDIRSHSDETESRVENHSSIIEDTIQEEKSVTSLEEHSKSDEVINDNKDEDINESIKVNSDVSVGKNHNIEIPKDDKPSGVDEEKYPIVIAKDIKVEDISQPQKEEVIESQKEKEEVGEAIEEPLMIVTGEGNGADCESGYIIGEEITEEVMFFYGEGSGYDNDTGNPEIIEETNSCEDHSDEENGNEELLNGEHTNSSSKSKLVKSVKLKSSTPTVPKRALKKQSNVSLEVLKSDPKKHCIRNSNKSDNSNLNSKSSDVEKCANDRNTESETPWKSRIKKGRSKVKKKKTNLTNSAGITDGKDKVKSMVETDNGHDSSKSSIIEKRKSSVSSIEQDDGDNIDSEKEKSPDKELKAEDPLPPKKLRLESTPESDNHESHSRDPLEIVNNSESNNETVDPKENDVSIENESIKQRKKIKASKGKFKRKRLIKDTDNDVDKSADKDSISVNNKKSNKSLKRSLLDATMSDKNKSESHSDSDEDEPATSGKRLKIRPKKMVKSSRKKIEAKLKEEQSTDESEEETLYSLAGKKSSKKFLKKKPKGKEKGKGGGSSGDSDVAPVRQSRRIAQMKIKEEAERRHLEEVALREMKMIHKKKNKDEEEWRASGGSSSESEKHARARGRAGADWRPADSTGPDQDSDSEEPLFDLHEEPDLDFNKSDHEFSPESDLESGEPVEPMKRARTLQEEKDDGFCKRCGSGEQPEWILLCDKCDAGYHASCLKPMLFLVPEGDWFCPPCNHGKLIASLENELTKFDELVAQVEIEREERARRRLEQGAPSGDGDGDEEPDHKDDDKSSEDSGSGGSDWSSSSEDGAVYRLRARRQLPVSYRAQEYDRLISSAIKEEYVEPTTSAGNQGRGKDISTIIEAAEEEKLKAEREAIEQGKPIEVKKMRKKSRRKPRKLNSLEVPSEDDDETDEDFKDTGMESSSEEISSSAERDSSNDSHSSDSLPIARRTGRNDRKDRPKLRESSPEVKKKKKGVLDDTSSESGGTKEWSGKKSKKSKLIKRRDKSSKKSRKRTGLSQYDADGNIIRARVTYGGLSDDEPNDWSPKHRTRQKKINYTEMPNTESEDEMHKSSGKHMPDSSDEFKLDDSELESSDSERAKRRRADDALAGDERQRALSDLIKKTAVVPLEKLPEDVTKAKTEELQAHLSALSQAEAQASSSSGVARGRGRGGWGGWGGRGARARSTPRRRRRARAPARPTGPPTSRARPPSATASTPAPRRTTRAASRRRARRR